MSIVQRIIREPVLVLGLVTAGLSLAVLFGVPLTGEQVAGVGVFLGALMALTRKLTVPAGEVLAQAGPDGVVAGAASSLPTGSPADIVVRRAPPPDR